eukprot:g4822.t1
MEKTDSVLLLPALDNCKTERVVWTSVVKLVKYINKSRRIDKDLQYSLKRRVKCSDSARVLNTLTVYHTISLNCNLLIRQQLSDRKCLQMFGKICLRSRDSIIQHAILQLLMDWSYLFSREDLGRKSDPILQEIILRLEKSPRPSPLAMQIHEERIGGHFSSVFVRGFEFEYRRDQVSLEDDYNCKVARSCRPTMHRANFTFGSVKRIFGRSSSKSLASSIRSPIVLELSTRPPQLENSIVELSLVVPMDCKKLQDLLSELQFLITKKDRSEVDARLQLAESLRNKCQEWKHKIIEIVTLRIHHEVPLLDEEDDETRATLVAKLLSIGQMLQSVLANFEEVHEEYVIQFDNTLKEKKEQRVNEEDDALSFVSAKSALSTASVNFESSENINWEISSAEKGGSGDALTCQKLPTLRVDSGLNNKPPEKSNESLELPLSTRSTSSILCSKRSLGVHSEISMECLHSLWDSSNVVSSPLSLLSGGNAGLLFDKGSPPNCINRTSNSHTNQQEPSSVALRTLEGRSRSFSELKSIRDQDLTYKRIINCPALKVRFTDDYLVGVLNRMNELSNFN